MCAFPCRRLVWARLSPAAPGRGRPGRRARARAHGLRLGRGLWSGHGCRPAPRFSVLLEGLLTRSAAWAAPASRVAMLLSEPGRRAGGCGQQAEAPGRQGTATLTPPPMWGKETAPRPAGGGSALMGSALGPVGTPASSGSPGPSCARTCVYVHSHSHPCTGPALGEGREEGRETVGRATEVTPCSCSSGPWGAAGCIWVLQGGPWRAWRPWPWPACPSSSLQWQRPPASGWGSRQGVGGRGLLEALWALLGEDKGEKGVSGCRAAERQQGPGPAPARSRPTSVRRTRPTCSAGLRLPFPWALWAFGLKTPSPVTAIS